MKLLKALKIAFGHDMVGSDIKHYLEQMRLWVGDTEFVDKMLNTFGSRDFNRFLDYKLLAIKISELSKFKYGIRDYKEETGEYLFPRIIDRLFFDDRHDMYQNIPYYLNDLVKLNPDKLTVIMRCVALGIIGCFNVDGTGDRFSETAEIVEE